MFGSDARGRGQFATGTPCASSRTAVECQRSDAFNGVPFPAPASPGCQRQAWKCEFAVGGAIRVRAETNVGSRRTSSPIASREFSWDLRSSSAQDRQRKRSHSHLHGKREGKKMFRQQPPGVVPHSSDSSGRTVIIRRAVVGDFRREIVEIFELHWARLRLSS